MKQQLKGRGGPKQGRDFGSGRAYAWNPQDWEMPWVVWGFGLSLNETVGAQACLVPLVSESGGTHLGTQQASWA